MGKEIGEKYGSILKVGVSPTDNSKKQKKMSISEKNLVE